MSSAAILPLVPINSRSPADWKQQVQRWGRFHYVRVAVIALAFAALTAALV